jgi:hypothetical protein
MQPFFRLPHYLVDFILPKNKYSGSPEVQKKGEPFSLIRYFDALACDTVPLK